MDDSSADRVRAAWAAFGSRDHDRIRHAFTDDAEWLAPAGNATAEKLAVTHHMVGVDAIVRFLADDFPRLFVADVNVEFTAMHAAGDVVVEETMSATLADGHRYENDYCFIFELENGLIRRVREYMDTARGRRLIFGDSSAT